MVKRIIGLVQMRMSSDPALNVRKAIRMVETLAARGAQVVCLPELFRSRYFPQTEQKSNFRLAESVPGPTTDVFCAVARRSGVVIVLPLFERASARHYHNAAVVVDADGSLAGVYRKMHVPNEPRYRERFYFAPGDLGFGVHQTRYGRIGVLICWDQWFPEAARLSALGGAQILFYPTAIGSGPSESKREVEGDRASWELIQRSHAVANGIYVAAVNRVGREGKIWFWGNSFVCGPGGEILTHPAGRKEEILLAPCDLSKIGERRRHWPFFRDRRVDAYRPILSRFLKGDAPR